MNELKEYAGHCPYCGEQIELLIDTSQLSHHYIEDCQVCCQPMCVAVEIDFSQQMQVSLTHENE